MFDDRGESLGAASLGELRKTLRRAGVGRAFGRGLRRRMPQWATVPLWLGLGVVALSVGSVFAFDVLRRWLGIELEPVYKIHSVRWWAEELVVLGVVVGLPLFLIGATLTWSERRRVSQRAATAVELGFCGGCGYDLRSLVAMEDGCVVCPECGAAWRLDSAREG